jgi:anti-sigma factor RsiW
MRETMNNQGSHRHLTDAELFSLAAPAVGEPEELPAHLSACEACSRSLQEWKSAMRALAEEDVTLLENRPVEEWRRAEDAALEAVRRAGRPSRGHPVRWAIGIAATLLIAVLAVPGRREAAPASAPGSAEMSAADQADDSLLRDAAFLARGGDLAAEESL